MRYARTVFWLLVALLGFGVMSYSYTQWMRVATPSPWTDAAMAVAEKEAAGGLRRSDAWEAKVRFLPADAETQEVLRQLVGKVPPNIYRSAEWSWQPKLILVPDFPKVFSQDMLASGRLPAAGSDELLAGPDMGNVDRLEVAGRTLRVVGTLRRQGLPFSQGYLVPDSPSAGGLFGPSENAVHEAIVLPKPSDDRPNETEKEQFRKSVQQGKITVLFNQDRVDRLPYYLYQSGVFLFIAGGSGLLVCGYLAWGRRKERGWIGEALGEIRQHKRLFVALHVVYFGLYLAASVVIYEVPRIQELLLMVIQGETSGGSGLLGIAGTAYGTGNIALAAGVTLAINFLAGSILSITLPSVIIPGSGALLAIYRATIWGLLLGPSGHSMAAAMLPHNLCLLLEGEGYILAAFFGLLIPIYLVRSQGEAGFWARWGRGILINLKGNVLVLLVLAVAALYEAIEVILMSR